MISTKLALEEVQRLVNQVEEWKPEIDFSDDYQEPYVETDPDHPDYKEGYDPVTGKVGHETRIYRGLAGGKELAVRHTHATSRTFYGNRKEWDYYLIFVKDGGFLEFDGIKDNIVEKIYKQVHDANKHQLSAEEVYSLIGDVGKWEPKKEHQEVSCVQFSDTELQSLSCDIQSYSGEAKGRVVIIRKSLLTINMESGKKVTEGYSVSVEGDGIATEYGDDVMLGIADNFERIRERGTTRLF